MDTATMYSTTRTPEAERINQLRPFIGSTVEMLAGADDLTADRGRFVGFRAGDQWTETAAIVEFERNGRFAIPVSMLFIPECDHIVQETSAFILLRHPRNERQLMVVSFHLMPNAKERANANHDEAQR